MKVHDVGLIWLLIILITASFNRHHSCVSPTVYAADNVMLLLSNYKALCTLSVTTFKCCYIFIDAHKNWTARYALLAGDLNYTGRYQNRSFCLWELKSDEFFSHCMLFITKAREHVSSVIILRQNAVLSNCAFSPLCAYSLALTGL